MIKGCFGCVFDLIRIGLGGIVVIIGIAYFLNKNNLVTIKSCYEGDTCTSTKGEKIRLACIDTSEFRGAKTNPVRAKEARDYLNSLIASKDLDIRRITKDKYGRTVAELSINGINVQRIMVIKGYAKIYSKYAYQCPWTR